MKTTLNLKIFLIAAISFLFAAPQAFADDDKPITLTGLPQKAQTFIAAHFPQKEIAVAKQEGHLLGKSYDVIFTNGDKVEFNRSGEWTKVSCRHNSVPQGIVPAQIMEYINKNYPGATVKDIEKEDWLYEVGLNNGIDLKFNNSFKLVNIDL